MSVGAPAVLALLAGAALAAQAPVAMLPPNVAAVVRKQFASADFETRYLDGSGCPGNPTVRGARVRRTTDAGAQVVIREFSSFEDAKPLPAAGRSSESQKK